jgi:biopolymer transport protein ExbD
MAEVSQQGGNNTAGKIRSNKSSTKIDMTPMVDLAFLLLTFFILTTTFNKPKVMELTMPEDGDITQPVNGKNVLNLILSENNKIFWYIGLEPPVFETNYSSEGVRKLLLDHKHKNPKLVVLIKPEDKSKYENVVDVLDEIDITNTQCYAIVDLSDDDREVLKTKKLMSLK